MNLVRSLAVWFTGSLYVLITFPLTLIVWLLTFPFDRNRRIVHRVLMWESYVITMIMPVWRVRMEGRKKASPGQTYVIISNHQSVLDILVINCLRYNYKWISKIENFKVPFIGWYLRMADYIVVERGNEESKVVMLEQSARCLRKGISIMIFPEGTRSADRNIGFFKRGAFSLALEAQVPVLPVLVDGTGGMLPRHGFIFGSRREIKVKVFDPVFPEEFGTADPDQLALRMSNFMASELKKMREAQN